MFQSDKLSDADVTSLVIQRYDMRGLKSTRDPIRRRHYVWVHDDRPHFIYH